MSLFVDVGLLRAHPLHMEMAVQQQAGVDRILTREAADFVSMLHREFNPRREELLARRERVKREIDAGKLPDFLPETRSIREREWKVAAIPADLLDRRVEITGPVDRKMIINALNSGAHVFMADFQAPHAPTLSTNIESHIQLPHP